MNNERHHLIPSFSSFITGTIVGQCTLALFLPKYNIIAAIGAIIICIVAYSIVRYVNYRYNLKRKKQVADMLDKCN